MPSITSTYLILHGRKKKKITSIANFSTYSNSTHSISEKKKKKKQKIIQLVFHIFLKFVFNHSSCPLSKPYFMFSHLLPTSHFTPPRRTSPAVPARHRLNVAAVHCTLSCSSLSLPTKLPPPPSSHTLSPLQAISLAYLCFVYQKHCASAPNRRRWWDGAAAPHFSDPQGLIYLFIYFLYCFLGLCLFIHG